MSTRKRKQEDEELVALPSDESEEEEEYVFISPFYHPILFTIALKCCGVLIAAIFAMVYSFATASFECNLFMSFVAIAMRCARECDSLATFNWIMVLMWSLYSRYESSGDDKPVAVDSSDEDEDEDGEDEEDEDGMFFACFLAISL